MARIRVRPRPRPRTSSEILRALGLPDLAEAAGGAGDCRVWVSVLLGRDGGILLGPLRLRGGREPPGYAACLRRLPRLLRRGGFPAGLSVPREAGVRAGNFRSL